MFGEREPQFNNEKRAEISFENRIEEQTLDYIISKERVKRLEIKDFVDHYGKATVAEDQAVVEALERKFKEELEALPPVDYARRRLSQKRGEVLEIIIAEQGELSDWFGPDAMTTRTSKIDDYINKVDLIIEFSQEEGKAQPTEKNVERVALAIDASDDPRRFVDKVQINREKLTGKRPPAHVQYFRSQVTGYEGPLNRIVPVAVGLEGKNMRDLVYLQNKSVRGIDLKATNEQLANHPAQRIFIEEIVLQLKWYLKLLERERGAHSMYEKKDVESILGTMEELLKDKKSIPLGEFEGDTIRQEIEKIVK